MSIHGLHVFCSVKGGVGKSSLAVITAKLLATHGRAPVVIDADMLGASLADGLRLRAPIVNARTDGTLDLEASSTNDWYTVKDTRALRDQRGLLLERTARDGAASFPALAPAFLNDALNYDVSDAARECNVGALLWKHEQEDGVVYLPSSPLRVDAAQAARHAIGAAEFLWVRRLSWLIDGLLDQRPELTDVVLDLPPGTWGFAHEIMVLAGALAAGQQLPEGYPGWGKTRLWRVNPFIVTSRDRNDRLLAMDYWLYTRKLVSDLLPLCNRLHEGLNELRAQVRADLPAALQSIGLENKLRGVPELAQTLGKIFVNGDVYPEQAQHLIEILRLQEFIAEGHE